MADKALSGRISGRYRYVIAIAVLLVFAFVLFTMDRVMSFLVVRYIPGLEDYLPYIWESSNALVGVLGAYIIYRIMASVVNLRADQRHEIGSGEIEKLALRVLFFFVAIFIILTSFGISLGDALAGSAIGGIVLGLAVQTITTSILSGILVSSSKTLLPGDIVVLRSTYWSSADIIAEVVKVNMLYTSVRTQNGNMTKIPNPLLLNYTVMTHIKWEDELRYPLQVTVNADVPASAVQSGAEAIMRRDFDKARTERPSVVFASKTQGANTFSVIIKLSGIEDFDRLVSMVNSAFDAAYWQAKRKAGK